MTERKPIIPLVERDTPILTKIRGRLGKDEKTVANQDELVLSFRKGIAEGLGLPLEVVEEQNVRLWIVTFIKSFVAPEYQAKISPKIDEVIELGKYIGIIARSAYEAQSVPVEGSDSSDSKSSPPRKPRDFDSVIKGE